MVYPAKDLWEAAFLRLRGIRPAGTTTEGKWVQFVFEDGDGCASQTATEYLGNPTVPLRDFKDHFTTLRQALEAIRAVGM